MRQDSYYINRTLCDALNEMRACYETRNFASLLGLIEEAQSMGNRMEAALGDQKDLREMNEEWHRLKKEIKELRKERATLDDEHGE
jgi:predicted RNase H-like nuclease (RuvC/YqgF family)